ncbi:glycoside hydrolase family 31 protein [Thalassobacillus sp. CUG 92003]|uniref:glycoside hydrolase family 31 protein n=1 Tax=Thalassobacillus sp. CUG 92003 TaxID=2736641 RepID=UPI0015E69A78|nr:glycoside hydrolase family 31 protein [Thalassobacillus sp. CUG 92003]
MLEDTSFAIQPDRNPSQTPKHAYYQPGDLLDVQETEDGFRFVCNHAYVDLDLYRSDIVRVNMQPSTHKVTPINSRAVIQSASKDRFRMIKDKEAITLESSKCKVIIAKHPFQLKVINEQGTVMCQDNSKGMVFSQRGEVAAHKVMKPQDRIYGLGEKSGFLEKRGESLTMWNTDVYAPHNPETDPLYESIPYFMVVNKGEAYGVYFNNTYKTTFDFKTDSNNYTFSAEGGCLEYYIFAGPSPKDVIEQYTYLTGTMPIPPKWALGYHQSRYSYESEREVRDLVDTFKAKGIPLDAVYLDIHYMDGYRVFTFDPDRFPDPSRLVHDLKEAGVRVVPIVDPGVKKDVEYEIYKEGVQGDLFCKYLEGDIYFGDVWPGASAFPDFTDHHVRKWWGEKHRTYSDLGIEGIWNDMNEPAVFNESKTMDLNVMHKNDGTPLSHRSLHNIYGLLMGEATYESMKQQLDGKRPFILTRAGFSGVQRYAAVWTGDNRSFWEHLQMSIPMIMNLGLSGVAYAGADIGGFAHDTNGELLTRWMQVGAFTPYFRNHSAIGTVYQEPWQFGEDYEATIKSFIALRYKWMPQLYSLFNLAARQGLPVMRPLMLEFPEDAKTYQLNDEFMIGDNVIIAPILMPEVSERAVYLPEGQWVDYFSGEVYEGGKSHLIYATIDQLPLFIRQGSAIVLGNTGASMESSQNELTLHVYADEKSSYQVYMYDDDGETFQYEQGVYKEIKIDMKCLNNAVHLDVVHSQGDYVPPYDKLEVVVHGLKEEQDVYINGDKTRHHDIGDLSL